jgi:hypothetical protein
MKDQIISFQTAILANEKGFNIETGELNYMLEGDLVGKRGASINCSKYVKSSTQTLLQRWLREVHKIDVFCDCIGSGLYYSVIYNNNVKEDECDKVFEQENTTSYEEALEIGLQEALKLIQK